MSFVKCDVAQSPTPPGTPKKKKKKKKRCHGGALCPNPTIGNGQDL